MSRKRNQPKLPPIAFAFHSFFPGVQQSPESPSGSGGSSLYREKGIALRAGKVAETPDTHGVLLAQMYAEESAVGNRTVSIGASLTLESYMDEHGRTRRASYNTGGFAETSPVALLLHEDGSVGIIIDAHKSDTEGIHLTIDELRELIRTHPRYDELVAESDD